MPLHGHAREVIDAAHRPLRHRRRVPMSWRRGTQTGTVEVLVEASCTSIQAP
jgi:hypothetical protein